MRGGLISSITTACVVISSPRHQHLTLSVLSDDYASSEHDSSARDILEAMVNRHTKLRQKGKKTLPRPEAWQLISDAEALARRETASNLNGQSCGESLSAMYARAATDGELLDDGVVSLIDALQLDESSVFADLGSGSGGALFRVASAVRMRAAYGVELINAKHEAAVALHATLADLLATPVTLWQGDLIEIEGRASMSTADASMSESVAFSEVTHLLTCSVCFDDFLLRRIASALGNVEAFPRFRALVSLRELPSQPHLVLIGVISLCCSWNTAAPGYIYVRADVMHQERDARPIEVLERSLCCDGICTLPASLQWPRRNQIRLPR